MFLHQYFFSSSSSRKLSLPLPLKSKNKVPLLLMLFLFFQHISISNCVENQSSSKNNTSQPIPSSSSLLLQIHSVENKEQNSLPIWGRGKEVSGNRTATSNQLTSNTGENSLGYDLTTGEGNSTVHERRKRACLDDFHICSTQNGIVDSCCNAKSKCKPVKNHSIYYLQCLPPAGS